MDCNCDKDGMSNWSYTAKTVVMLVQMLMIFYNLICFSDRTKRVKGSTIIIKPTQTLYTSFGHISPSSVIHVAATLRATIKEAA